MHDAFETYRRVEALEQAQKHTEAHFDLLEDQLQKLTDRIAALEEKK